MRRVLFKSSEDPGFGPEGFGYFHGWGTRTVCLHDGIDGIVTSAIVETDEGKIILPHPGNITFIDIVKVPEGDGIQKKEFLIDRSKL